MVVMDPVATASAKKRLLVVCGGNKRYLMNVLMLVREKCVFE